MKGTLFSADFIKDSSDNLRLLEINTDTAIVPEQINSVDWTDFINLLQSSSISDLHVVYKTVIHQELVDSLANAWEEIPGTTLERYREDKNTIYPSSVEDSADKFILRLAYDESAIFDSEYCKGRLNLYRLYHSGSQSSMITEFYYSSSEESYDTLTHQINPSNVPDVSIKDINETQNPIDFYKLGLSSSSDSDRWNGLISELKADDKLIEQYHYHSSSVDEDGCLTSYRTFYIVHGSDLDLIHLHSYKNSSIFDLPTDISSEVDDTVNSNKLADHHYYEYTTNAFKVDGAGLLSTDKIQMADDSYSTLGDVEVGDSIKSFFISGSPQVESDYTVLNWSYSGSEFPSGSYVTSSAVVFKNTEELHYNGLIEYVVGGDSQFSGTSKQFLVYDSGSDTTKYKHAVQLDTNTDYFYKYDGTLIDLDEVNYYITSDTGVQIVELDVEDTDTYIISGSTAFNAVVSHNNPCFIAGTQISKGDDTSANIEDIQIGDIVKSYNFDKSIVENREVRGITKKKIHETVKYTFSDSTELRATLDHPLYCVDKDSWVSNAPDFTYHKYQLTTQQIEVGDNIQKLDGTNTTITSIDRLVEDVIVYNLVSIDTNHNFYANNYLVHNRCFVEDTDIILMDGSVVAIENVQPGDKVRQHDVENEKSVEGIVGEVSKYDVDTIIQLIFDCVGEENIIETTEEHPFYVIDKGWIKAGELKEGMECYSVSGPAELKSITKIGGTRTVYNLLSVGEHNNFFANGILVHNK